MDAATILIVEDDVMIRMMMADVVRDEGYQVIEAASGDEGMAILNSGQTVNLIVTDVRMPGAVDGVALTAYAKQTQPARPVIVVSGHLAPEAADKADAFLQKPFLPSTILQTIGKLIETTWHQPPQTRNAL